MKIFKIVAILSLLLLSNLASAHSRLRNSNPENGAMLNRLPENLLLEFTAQVKLVKLQLEDQSGKPIKLMTTPSKKFATTFNIALPILNMGSYQVKWVVMGKDAHKMKGDFTFMVHDADMGKMHGSSDEQNNNAD